VDGLSIPAASLPTRLAEPTLDLLSGVTVLDLTTSLAGPYAGQILADLGATVIKIEKPIHGDDSRAWGPPFLDGESLWYMSVNRNKRSITLDYAAERGSRLFCSLVSRADVVLINVTARVQRKLRIDRAALSLIKPDLIHASITGFGLDGPKADLPCYDLIAEGYSGVMDMTGEMDSPPQKVGTPAADLLAGEDAALAIVAALYRRHRSGSGAQIDISMIESMTRFMAPRLVAHMGSGEMFRRSGGRDSVIAIYQSFETADKPLTLALGNDAIWKRFWGVVGQPERAHDPAYASNPMRRANREILVTEIAAILLTRPRDEWLALFIGARVPAGPIYRLDEVAADTELHRRGFLYRFERNGKQIPQVGLGIKIDGRSEALERPPPKIGQDNLEIFSEWLGLESSEIEQLSADGII
jgi:crotonobetainyl-CoA:carnitine CoA-transferase CaiB-like acyl-CoA transferase